MLAARRLMRRNNIRHLPILADGVLKGVVSQRDLYFFESIDDDDPKNVTVAEVMTEQVLSVSSDTLVTDVARQMAKHKYGSAIVIDEGAVVGIFTTMDALTVLAAL